jgi:chemotaxis protein CheZ
MRPSPHGRAEAKRDTVTDRTAVARDTDVPQNAGSGRASAPRPVRPAPDAMRRVSAQLAALRVGEFASERLPMARRELEAMLSQSLSSIEAIMTAAEHIMMTMADRPEGYETLVREKVTEIFVACAFQDITAQRGRRLNGILDSIEQRLSGLSAALAAPGQQDDDEPALSGPALPGDGNDQAAVDALFRPEPT